MHLTTDCPRGWYFNPKYAAWLEAAGEAQSNECLCQQPRRPTEEEIIAAGHPALNSRNYKSHAASGLKALGSFASCPLSHLTFDCWSNLKKKKKDFLKSKTSRDWMPVHNLHCSQAHQLWGLSMARIRPRETTLRPLCSAYSYLLSQGSLSPHCSRRIPSTSRWRTPSFFHMMMSAQASHSPFSWDMLKDPLIR